MLHLFFSQYINSSKSRSLFLPIYKFFEIMPILVLVDNTLLYTYRH
jgi:hypothetical protein